MIYTNAGYPGGGCIFIPITQTGAYTVIHEFYPFFWEDHPWGSGGVSANAFFMNWGASYGENIQDAFLGHENDYNSYVTNYSSYYLFTLVRCPYDRAISGWKFVPSLSSSAVTFSSYTGNIPTRNVNFDEHNRRNFRYRMAGKTQKKTLKNSSGTYLTFDYVMKYESIQQDWDAVCDALGRSRSTLDTKLSIWLDCAPVYSCDKKTYFPYTTYPGTIGTNRANISSSFSEDFKQFSYSIGNETLTQPTYLYQFENNFEDHFNNYDLTPNNTGAFFSFDDGVPVSSGGYAFICDSTASPESYAYESGTQNFDSTFSSNSHTFYLWFKCPDRSFNQTLFSWSDSTGGAGGSILRLYNGKLKFIVGNSSTQTEVTSSLRIKNNRWNFACCIYNNGNNDMTLFLNANKYTGDTGGTPPSISANSRLYVGREGWGNYSDCKIDQVAIFSSTTLTDTQVRDHYNNGQGRYYV